MKGASKQAMNKASLEAAKNKAFKAGIRAGIYKGVRNEAIASGVVEGGLDAGIQKRNTELDLQDGYSATQGAMAVGGGALIGGALGGVLGPLGGLPDSDPGVGVFLRPALRPHAFAKARVAVIAQLLSFLNIV